MGTKNVYVNPGDIVRIRVVNDEFEPTASGWREQSYKDEIGLHIVGFHEISVFNPMVTVTDFKGKQLNS